MLSSPIKLLAAAGLAAATLLLPVAPVGAGIIEAGELVTEPTGDRDAPSFTFEFDGPEPTCDNPDVSITADGDDAPGVGTPLDAETVLDFDTPLSGTFAPGADEPAGYFTLEIVCEDGQLVETYVGTFAFARLTVAKVVEGTAPADASFTVEVDCDSGEGDFETFTDTIEFGATGGEAAVVLYGGTVCTTTETADGGATSSSVEGGVADFTPNPIDLTATVTNVFVAPDPTPTPTPAPTPGAQPVVAQPTFTG